MANNYRTALINKRFGRLTVKEFHSIASNGHIQWLCNCDCGTIGHIVRTECLNRGLIKSCGCSHNRSNVNSPTWRGVGEIGMQLFSRYKRDASKRKLLFNITIKQAWDKFLQQNRKCALTGIDLKFKINKKDIDSTASLDRINSNKGYTADNIQWVHKDVNTMKWDFDQNYFLKMVKLINDYNAEVV